MASYKYDPISHLFTFKVFFKLNGVNESFTNLVTYAFSLGQIGGGGGGRLAIKNTYELISLCLTTGIANFSLNVGFWLSGTAVTGLMERNCARDVTKFFLVIIFQR